MGSEICFLLLAAGGYGDPRLRRILLATAVLYLGLGFGLWKRQLWGLYLLTGVFVAELCTLLAAISRGAKRQQLLPVLYLHALMLCYFWRRKREFV